MSNQLQTFKNPKFGQIRFIVIDGKEYAVGNDVARMLEYSRPHEAVASHCKGAVTYRILTEGGEQETKVIPEGDIYRLIVKAADQSKNPEIKAKAEEVEKWIFDEVLPSIRKTGGYVSNDDLFINTYLPFADETTKSLFKTTLQTVRQQNELIQRQQKEIQHKEDVIIGLVDQVELAEKRQVLNRVVRHNNANFQERWRELYKQFEMKYHIDLDKRIVSYNLDHKPKLKTKLDYIDKVMGKLPELYEIACKLYEGDIKELTEQMYKLNKPA